jgi:hypothetical protein
VTPLIVKADLEHLPERDIQGVKVILMFFEKIGGALVSIGSISHRGHAVRRSLSL